MRAYEEPPNFPSAPPAEGMPPGQGYVQYQQPLMPELSSGGKTAVSPISAVTYQPPETVTYVPGPGQQDEDAPEWGFADSFSDKVVRQRFISKVYSILTVQLIILFGTCLTVSFIDEAVIFVQQHWLALVCTGVVAMFGVLLITCCNPQSMRVYPGNYVLLVIFTLGTAVSMVFTFTIFTTESLLYTIGTTLLIFLVLTIFAKQTSYDFTQHRGILLVALLLLILFGIVQMFFPGKTMNLVYHSLGVFIFCIYIIVDTQLIMGGHRFEISPEDYMLASLALFLDIVNLFLQLLHLMGERK